MILFPFRLSALLRSRPRSLGLFGAFALLGCRDLNGFDTKPGYAYCGSIAGAPFQASFVPQGQPPDLTLALTLQMAELATEPGVLNSSDAANGLCSASGQPLFDDAPLRAIPEVDQDAISAMTFGEGHQHDFFAWVDSTCQGTMLAVVSLLKNNLVEVRLFKPAAATAAEKPGFAVFHLDLRRRAQPGETPEQLKEDCGF